jgi:glycosyltransferase involved in cell wall biosynthesis
VVARNYLAQARVLARSLHRSDPDTPMSLLLLDDLDGEVDPALEPFEIVRPEDLDLDRRELHAMAMIYDLVELATAVKPWLLSHLLETDEVVCYLDPDIEVFAPLGEVERLAAQAPIVLTPHTTVPMPRDGRFPSEQTVRLAGVFNLGFIAVSRESESFLAWWSERLRRECRVAVEQGLFVDQRWIDFVPTLFEHRVLVDPGYNVAYWNLYDREIKLGADGYEVHGEPLRFLHYSGFDPTRPYRLSKHQPGEERVRLSDPTHTTLAHLCQRYAAQLLDDGFLEAQSTAYGYDFTARGVRIDARMRRLYREALDDPALDDPDGAPLPDPFDAVESDAFMAWLTAPGPAGSRERVPRYARSVYEDRVDLQAHFGDLAGPGAETYLEWVRRHGRVDAGIPPELVPAPRPARRPAPGAHPAGVNVVGYLRAEDGVGSVARSLVDVLRRSETPLGLRTCTTTASRQCATAGGDDETTFDVTIACINADQLGVVIEDMCERWPRADATVGVWAWEVDAIPEWMARQAAHLDEVWVYSRHAAEALAPHCGVPVHVFAPPIELPEPPAPADRAAAGFGREFTFLFCFDFHSVFERKNPIAVVSAFQRAFAPGEGPRLVIKSVNAASDPLGWARLRAAAAGRADIELRDSYESAAGQRSLMAACDAYVSLHRAEGYGLTLLEAMALGKPVIGTGTSGNLEFMTEDTSVLVPYEPVRVPRGCGPYPPDASWAAPDIDEAARAMRALVSDPASAAALGSRARTHVAQHHSVDARVDFVRTRVAALRSST